MTGRVCVCVSEQESLAIKVNVTVYAFWPMSRAEITPFLQHMHHTPRKGRESSESERECEWKWEWVREFSVVNFYEFIWLINKNVFAHWFHNFHSTISTFPQMYDNVKSLRLVKEGSHTLVTAMISSEGEVMEFRNICKYRGLPLFYLTLPPCPLVPWPLLAPPHCRTIPTHWLPILKLNFFMAIGSLVSLMLPLYRSGWLTNFF